MYLSLRFLTFFYFYRDGDHRVLHVLTHPFPTRRSSDLLARTDDFWMSLAARPIDQSSLAALRILHAENPGQSERSSEALAGLVEEVSSERSEEHTSELQSLMRI